MSSELKTFHDNLSRDIQKESTTHQVVEELNIFILNMRLVLSDGRVMYKLDLPHNDDFHSEREILIGLLNKVVEYSDGKLMYIPMERDFKSRILIIFTNLHIMRNMFLVCI